jgi:NAD(P)H-nitrite reductase large subunit
MTALKNKLKNEQAMLKQRSIALQQAHSNHTIQPMDTPDKGRGEKQMCMCQQSSGACVCGSVPEVYTISTGRLSYIRTGCKLT